jgi:glycosyltransferase involved in cell wall biosynthesis
MNNDGADAAKPDLVIVCQVFYPELVSTGQTLTELVEELAGSGLKITVIAAQPTLLKDSPRVPRVIYYKGVTILRTWSTRLPKTRFFGKLLNLTTFFISSSLTVLFKYRKTQLMLLTNPPYLPLLGWLCWRIRKQPFGVVLFDIMPEQAELLGVIRPGGLAARAWRRLNWLWYRRAAYVTVLSRDMLEGALKNASLFATEDEETARARTHVIHIWADDRLIRPLAKSDSVEAARLGVRERFVIQYSGNHGRFHDIESLLGLAGGFTAEDGFVFQFIGEGQKKKLVEARLAASPHFYSSSYVAKESLADSLAMADLGVVAQLPGQERVCYPSKLLGIMAAGRAILAICPEDCEMARMIRDEQLGFVIPNGDLAAGRRTLLSARDNPDSVDLMGQNASRHLRAHFTLGRAAAAYLKIVSEQLPRARQSDLIGKRQARTNDVERAVGQLAVRH